MSADLFAEFTEPAKPAPPTTTSSPFGQPATQAQGQPPSASQDNFDFFQSSNNSNTGFPQPSQQWPSFTPQSNSLGGWGGSNPSPAPQASAPGAADDDDDWGDFETSEPKPAPPPAQPQQTSQWVPPQQPIQWQSAPAPAFSQEPKRGVVRADTMELMTNSLISMGDQPKPAPAPSIREESKPSRPRPQLKQAPSDPNVLFDAGDFELEGGGEEYDYDEGDDDDDFGDFETVAPTSAPARAPAPAFASSRPAESARPAAKPAPPSLDLLGLSLDDPPQKSVSTQSPQQASGSTLLGFGATTTGYPNAPKSPSFQQRNPFPELAVKTPIATEFKKDTPKTDSPVTAWPSFEPDEPKEAPYQDDDEWGAWDDMPSGAGKATAAADLDATKSPESWDWDAVDNVKSAPTKVEDDAPPPVNVPPPSVILSIFPDLLSSAGQLFKPMAGQSASIKDRILSDPKAVEFLQGYMLLACTAGHVIAGRKHRWHRDKILAKSMSISAAGSKGMKLAGVDKTQSAREDREAADVVAVWRDNVGRLRSAVAAANSAGKASLKVPELGETMQVQTAKMAPTAAKACIICGLKREERVGKVDHEVEDSFGEWWVEHWGHRACKNFWIEHEQKLRQR